jgi:hypothetical protein
VVRGDAALGEPDTHPTTHRVRPHPNKHHTKESTMIRVHRLDCNLQTAIIRGRQKEHTTHRSLRYVLQVISGLQEKVLLSG